MAVQTITYSDKSYINENASIAATNKITDSDMNEIKSVVNNNATELSTLSQKTINSSDSNYIKYEDGTMVCFYSATVNTNITTSWGNLYISPQLTIANYPVAFTTTPIVSMFVQGGDGAMIFNGDFGTNTRPPKIYLTRGATQSTAVDFIVNIIAIGKWN